MSDLDVPWPTTTPEARLASAPDKVPVRDSLSPGTRLDEFEIVRVLGTGGFGIVYLARDHVLQREVAIKEYMPAALSRRGEGAAVAMRATGGCAATFAKGLESFLSEARLLASFDHPALVKVHRFWRGNATAYMAMPYYPGETLKDVRLQMRAAPDEAWLQAFIQPLLGALELLHGQGVVHRDISPDNILMLPDGQPVLLDFGSARRAVADSSQWFTAHLKPQFAPLEQYADDAGMRQGPWTDLYSLGATLHFVVTGHAPVPSVVRAVRDVLPTLSSLAASSLAATSPTLSDRLLATIDWTLALAPDDRPQDVQAVRRALRGEIAVPPLPPRQPGSIADAPSVANVEGSQDDAESAAGTATPDAEPPAAWEATAPAPGTGLAVAPSTARSRMRVGTAAALALIGLAAVGWGWHAPEPNVPVVSEAAAAARVAPTVTSAQVAPTVTAKAEAPSDPLPTVALTPVALPLEAFLPSADPVAHLMSSNAPAEYSFWNLPARAPAGADERSAAPPRLVWTPPPVAESPRGRPAARHKPRAASSPVKTVAHGYKDACSGAEGLVASALCVLNPCKDPRARKSTQCLDRQRAEQARLARMEWR